MVASSALLALVVVAAFTVLLVAIDDLRGAERSTGHAQDVLIATNSLERLVLDLETGQRGFVLTRQERFLEPWNAARGAFPRRVTTLLTLVAGEATAERAAREIARRERAYIHDYSVPLVSAARRGDPWARSVAATAAGKRRVDAMRAAFDRLLTAELSTDARSKASADSAARSLSAVAAIGIAGSVVLIALYAGYLTRAIVRPVRGAAGMAGRLAGGDLSAQMPETGVGEVGALERAFNVMGSSLKRSRDELAAIADEQAALRRVATLVARGRTPEEVFAAVVEEVGRLLPVEYAGLNRYECGGTVTAIAGWGKAHQIIPTGSRCSVGGKNLGTIVAQSGRPARLDGSTDSSGPLGVAARKSGIRSAVGTPILVEGRLWGMIAAGSSREQPLPADTEARLANFTELLATAIANAESRADLAASRARIVAAADDARRRIERDLHDGTQQQLVWLGLELRAAQTAVPPHLRELERELSRIAAGLASMVDRLREISHGIHPAILSEKGLKPALRALARRSHIPVELDFPAERRLPEHVEIAAYYVVSEALTNVAKHAHASVLSVELDVRDATVRLAIRDDGTGGADPRRGSGLVGLSDRIAALGGTLHVTSPAGDGTTLLIEIPLERQRSAGSPEP
jgi:signal transduction histidine kinase